VRIPQRERCRMAERLQGCEKRKAVLAADIDGQDAALSEVLSDLNAGREPGRLAVADAAPLAVRRAEAAEELLALIRESGSLRVGLMASASPFRTGGITGRSRRVRLLRFRAERDAAATRAAATSLRGEAVLLEMTRAAQGLRDADGEVLAAGQAASALGVEPGVVLLEMVVQG
jgi:hypothetical protein